MVLTSIKQYPDRGFAGMIRGDLGGIDTYVNATKNQKGVWRLVFTAANTTAYTFLINGIAITDTSDGSATKAEIAAMLLAKIEANTFANNLVTGEVEEETDDLLITERVAGTVTVTESDANIALTAETASLVEQNLEPGLVVGLDAVSGDQVPLRCRKLKSGDALINMIGATVHTHEYDGGYPPGRPVNVRKKGAILMQVEGTPAPTDTVFARIIATGDNPVTGKLRIDADTANAVSLGGRARFLEYAADGLCWVEFNIP